jgi:Peptidase MA superfamily/WD40-like Beta Propeller Repeat
MIKKIILFVIPFLLFQLIAFAQFGQNKVQYKNFDWYYIQTDHFDIYFYNGGANLAEFTAKIAEKSLNAIQNSFNYKINNRVSIIVYNSTNDFQETNTTDQYLTEGIEGFTELFKNRVVIQFMGSYKEFEHLIHHELTHAVINDMFYGGSLQNIISNNISVDLPLWFNEGMAEYQSLGWDVNTDMFIRDAIINEYLPDIEDLNGYFAYRGGEAVFHYIAEKYGKQKIGELVNKVRNTGSVNMGLKESIGLTLDELNDRWKKDIKKKFWPDVALHQDPDEFAKGLTDTKKNESFYNTSPAISPQGDKLAFISNRDYYFDVYLMNTLDGKIIKKVVEGNRSPDFEELNIVTPGLTWSPDGKKIALSAKSNGSEVIYIIDVESEDKESLPIVLDGISSVTWSPDGNDLAFVGHTAKQSDIYIYSLKEEKLTNLTNDIFSDKDPAWSSDGKKIYFASDRGGTLRIDPLNTSFKIYNFNYSQTDLYSINLDSKKITRITDTPYSDESYPVVSPDNKEILFISDRNGINNIYKKRVKINKGDSVRNIYELPAIPVTNSLNGLYQLSLSQDGKKLAFSSLYKGSFNLFLLNNPFEIKLNKDTLPLTDYFSELKKEREERGEPEKLKLETAQKKDTSESKYNLPVYTGKLEDTTHVYGDSVQIDFSNYVFGNNHLSVKPDTTGFAEKFKPKDNLDKQGDYYVNRYKITFTPDIVYANAGYSSLYGLLGTTIISFSDILGNHRLIGITSLQIDLKNSDYGLAYFYLPDRINYGVEAFHTARFVFLSRSLGYNLYRFRNYGAVLSASYPLNRFYRFEAGLSWLNVSMENLDDPAEPTGQATFFVPAVSFIHDNTLWGFTSPIDGTRYRFDFLANPGFTSNRLSFYSGLGDYRRYFNFWKTYSFVFRLSGGYSWGKNPQRFFLGGTDNWINRRFATGDIPLNSASDFAFLTAALPLRGYDYDQEIGTKYSLMNLELRFPLIRYLVTGGLPLLFSNILGVVFFDAGSAWTRNHDLRFFQRDINNNIVSKDLLMGTGVGARVFVLYFLLRFDVAWAYNVHSFSTPKYYISLGADF